MVRSYYPLAAELEWQPFAGSIGVREKVLWHQGPARAALLQLSPGARVEPHEHRTAEHHIWIVSGTATVADLAVQSGCYLYVPPASSHGAVAGMSGCTMFYLSQPNAQIRGGTGDGRQATRTQADDDRVRADAAVGGGDADAQGQRRERGHHR